ncbi:PTS lactose/cellobiose transporter subunit IIA [Peribacillus alkalitolerans]|uniref:PTS lactose/cellobiose transporter subunit IIA n=1 Tax=Peribacillus alkalitolerans TaxID=1550385 RepID=UPI0013D2D38D|nr:PTS lactose/cellobiose transporter subunit IIA [Peribacillus alkalitolerans]
MVEIEQIAFQIISSSGDALSTMMKALQFGREGNFSEADQLMKDASALLSKAHKAQTELIVKEARGEKSEYSIMMVHAQDHMMNALLAQTLISEMLSLYKKIG